MKDFVLVVENVQKAGEASTTVTTKFADMATYEKYVAITEVMLEKQLVKLKESYQEGMLDYMQGLGKKGSSGDKH